MAAISFAASGAMAAPAVFQNSIGKSSSARIVCVPQQRVELGSMTSSFCKRSLHTSFFDGGESSKGLSALVSTTPMTSGGALTAQMNIFDRVARIVKSYTNAALSAAEDPEKLLDQTVEEMNEDLIKLRQTSAQVLASQKQLENRYKQAQQNSDDWYRRAKLALEKGDELLAKEALKRRKDFEDNAKALGSQVEQQKSVVEKLISNTRLLESKIQEAKSKKDNLKARAQSAKTAQKVNDMLSGLNTSSALAAFDKMEEKVLQLEAESEAVNELSKDDLAGKFAMLESGDVDDDLAALKRDMLGTSKKSGELPPGRSSPAVSSGISVKDLEIEAELNELRRRAKDL